MKKKYVKPMITIIEMDTDSLLENVIITGSKIPQGTQGDNEGQMGKEDTFEDDWGNPFSDDPLDGEF